MRIPRRHVHTSRANCVGIDVFPLFTLRVGEEPKGGYRDELRDVDVGGVADKRVVAGEGLYECAAFGFGPVVYGVDKDVELRVGRQ